VRLEGEAVRNYPNGDLAAHVLGYTGEITEEELEEKTDAELTIASEIWWVKWAQKPPLKVTAAGGMGRSAGRSR
jgi:cell division protein FtsI/penicillin-binding protein 2